MIMRYILTILILFSMLELNYAQGTLKRYSNLSSSGLNIYADRTLDNGFIIAGITTTSVPDILINKLDVLGNIQWTYRLNRPGYEQTIDAKYNSFDSCYYILYQENNFVGNILKLNASGQVIYDRLLNLNGMKVASGSTNGSLEITSDNQLLVHAYSIDSANVYTMGLNKLDTGANTIWSRYYTYPGGSTFPTDVKECSDNNYIMLGYRDTITGFGNALMTYIIKVDTAGNKLWENNYYLSSYTWATNIKELRNGKFVVTGSNPTGTNQRLFTMLLDGNGTKLWHVNRAGLVSQYNMAEDLVENADSSFTITGFQYNSTPTWSHNMAFIKMDQNGNEQYFNSISTGVAVPTGKYIWHAPNNGYFIIGVDGQSPFLITTDSMGNLFTNFVFGRVFQDINNNCQFDAGEPPVNNCLINISAQNSNYQSLTSNNANGTFLMQADSGTFNLEATNISPYWQYCSNPQTINFTGFSGRDTVDFPLQIVDTCSFLEVDISSTIIRRCFPADYYVNYKNRGTITAQNAYVDVTLDPYVDFVSSSIPVFSQNGNVYRFQVGNLNINSQGYFTINTRVQCDTTVSLGQVHCTEAHIYPDSVCNNSLWNSAIINVNGRCDNDTAVFTIINQGLANSGNLNFDVIEDLSIIQNSNYQLNIGQQLEVRVPTSPGKYYRLSADQEPGYPTILGDATARSKFLYCQQQSNPILPALQGQFYSGNSSPFVSIDCQSNRGAYDPNDKNAQPLGYGPSHFIENNIPLNYHIRFQNTGTDTAFRVMIIDTLSAFLNPTSLRMGASSHPYRWELRTGNVLVVYFDNIMLPDSNVNEPASHGFFKMELELVPNLNDGIVITNEVGIYFDFNAPVITNQTFHTIGSDFVNVQTSSVQTTDLNSQKLIVYPNPSDAIFNFEYYGEQVSELKVEILDLNGRIVKNQIISNSNVIQLNCAELASGMYFYRCSDKNKIINSGKIIVK